MLDNVADRQKLQKAGRAFSDLLCKLTSLCKPKSLRPIKATSDGWYITVAEPAPNLANQNPSWNIGLWLDNYIKDDIRGFWVGFCSGSKKEVQKIIKGRPPEMTFVKSNKPTTEEINFPIEEYWEIYKEYYFGIYSEPGADLNFSRALTFICDVLSTIPGFENSVKLDEVSRDLAAIDSDPAQDDTVRKQLIDARIGQGLYRQKLEKLWGSKCAVLGISNRRVLRASHAKPWRLSDNNERLDPNNGLLLAAHLDALFDSMLITFDSKGALVIAPELSDADKKQLHLGERLRGEPSTGLDKFLAFHRREFKARHPGVQIED